MSKLTASSSVRASRRLLASTAVVALSAQIIPFVVSGCSAPASQNTESSNDEVASTGTRLGGVTFQTQIAGLYIGTQSSGAVVATASVPQASETFTLIDKNGDRLISGDEVFVQTASGTYLQAANGGGTTLSGASKNTLGWETFRVVRAAGAGVVQSGDEVGLQTTVNQTWVSAQKGGGGPVFAYGGSYGPWERMTIRITGATTGTGGGGGGGAGGGTGGSSGAFVHPGILVNKGMLDFVKGKIASNSEPWKTAFNHASSDWLGSLSYVPHPRADVDCGSASKPDNGCTDEKNDAAAAFTQALLWYHTGDHRHADMAIRIMNAWASTITEHTNSNAPLQSAWVAEVFPRAAEIIRYSDAGWSDADIAKFSGMLKNVYLPQVVNGTKVNGNWDTSMIEATMNIAVFLDDRPTFDKAIAMWRKRTPAYIYLASDGATPVQPPNDAKSASALKGFCYNPTQFVDGLSQESCRDLPNSGTQGFGHAQYGTGAIVNAAETALIQGVDLFAAEQTRIVAMSEFHAKFMNGASTSALCQTQIASVSPDPMWEIVYNEYANVRGVAMPETAKLVKAHRPSSATHHMVWETLTHGDIGKAGL